MAERLQGGFYDLRWQTGVGSGTDRTSNCRPFAGVGCRSDIGAPQSWHACALSPAAARIGDAGFQALFKFRTMTDARDASGNLLMDTDRLTPFGRLLRSTSLDELPEFFNVVRGDMSLVGPRPLLMRYTPYFTDEERIRFMVRPGITGLAQVSGRNNLNWDLRIATDVRYVRECSLALDLRILFLTIWHTLTRRGRAGGSRRSYA